MTNQQTDPTTGRVIPTREQVANKLMLISDGGNLGHSFDLPKLVEFIMQQKNDDYYRGVKLGLSIGRKEMVAAMETVIDTSLVTTELTIENMDDIVDTVEKLKADQRQRLKAMVGVLEKGGISVSKDEYVKLANKVKDIEDGLDKSSEVAK